MGGGIGQKLLVQDIIEHGSKFQHNVLPGPEQKVAL